MLLAVHHDRHPGDLLVLGRPDREGLDVEAAPGEQAGDANEDARLVLDQDRQSVLFAHEAISLALGARIRERTVLADSLARSLMRPPRWRSDSAFAAVLYLPIRSQARSWSIC